MDIPPGPSNESYNVNSDDEVVSNATDDQAYRSDSDDEIEPDYEAHPITWSVNTSGLRHIPFKKEEKLLVPIPGNRPIDFFLLLIDIIFLETIVRKTNAYAFELFCGPSTSPKSRITKWKDLTVEELKIFLGLMIDMGLDPKPRLQDYWRKTKTFTPTYGNFMSRNRFLLILRCLNFSTFDNNDRLSKVRYLVDYFNNKMDYVYYPQKNLSLDECMVLWRGRLYFKQYIQNKRHKYGIKLYTLCDPHGLILKFMIYCGVMDNLGGKGHAANVVLNLMRGKLGVGHSIYMDNYYNSIQLAAKLLSKDTYCTGTLRTNRKYIPADVKAENLTMGGTIARYGEGMMVGKWKDQRAVLYLSTEHENEMVTVINRRKDEVTKPLPIVKYNGFMKGVDRSDQMQAYYPMERKTLRWYKKMFIHTIQMMIVNAHYLFNENYIMSRKRKMGLYEFIESIKDDLLPDIPTVARPLKRTAEHSITKIAKKMGNTNRISRKKCRLCKKSTQYECLACPENPGLCAVRCFDLFHTA